MIIILTNLLGILLLGSCSIHEKLITDFIDREGVDSVILFWCNQNEQFHLSQSLNIRFNIAFQNFEVNSNRFYSDNHRLMSSKHHRFGLVVDLGCPRVEELLDFCSCQMYFNASYHWLFVGHKTIDESSELLKPLNLNIDTRMVIMATGYDLPGANQSKIYEVYNTVQRRGGKLQVVEVGTVEPDTEVIWTGSTKSYQHRKNLNGIKLHAVVTTLGEAKGVPVIEFLQNLEPPRRYSFVRYGYQMSVLLSEHLNFKIHLVITKGLSLEVLGTNSSKGLIGQLQRNLVDFAVNPGAIAKERLSAFDPTVPIAHLHVKTVFRRPKNGIAQNGFLLPFNYTVWGAVLLLIIFASVVLSLSFCMERRTLSFLKSLECLPTLGLLLQQPCSENPSTVSSHISIFVVLLFSFIIYQFYSTFVIGSLLMLPPRSIRSLEDLLASQLRYSIEDIAYNRDFFNRTTETTALQLYKQKILPNKYGFVDVKMGIHLIKQGSHAFHCDTSYLYTWISEIFNEQQICELDELFLYPVRPLHIPVPKKSPLKKLFKVTLRRLQETGLADYYRRKLTSKKPHCVTSSFDFVRVGFGDVASLMWMLALGIGAGLVVLAVEMVDFRVREYQERRDFLKKYPKWLD